MANIFISIEKGIEVAAEDVAKWINEGEAKVVKVTPGALAALALLATGVGKAALDVAGDAASPLANLINIPGQLADFLTLWPELKALIQALGVTKI